MWAPRSLVGGGGTALLQIMMRQGSEQFAVKAISLKGRTQGSIWGSSPMPSPQTGLCVLGAGNLEAGEPFGNAGGKAGGQVVTWKPGTLWQRSGQVCDRRLKAAGWQVKFNGWI